VRFGYQESARRATAPLATLRSRGGETTRVRLSPGQYDEITSMLALVIDVPSAKTRADASCRKSSSAARNAPTYDELFADQASRLKQLIHLQRKSCLRQFETQFLSIETENARTDCSAVQECRRVLGASGSGLLRGAPEPERHAPSTRPTGSGSDLEPGAPLRRAAGRSASRCDGPAAQTSRPYDRRWPAPRWAGISRVIARPGCPLPGTA
jgi:hypothetical protein